MNNEITSITKHTGQGDTFPSRYSSPSAGKRRNNMKRLTVTLTHTIKMVQADPNGFAKKCTTEALNEFKEFLVERQEIEYAIAEVHETVPPQEWVYESIKLQNQVDDELEYRQQSALTILSACYGHHKAYSE